MLCRFFSPFQRAGLTENDAFFLSFWFLWYLVTVKNTVAKDITQWSQHRRSDRYFVNMFGLLHNMQMTVDTINSWLLSPDSLLTLFYYDYDVDMAMNTAPFTGDRDMNFTSTSLVLTASLAPALHAPWGTFHLYFLLFLFSSQQPPAPPTTSPSSVRRASTSHLLRAQLPFGQVLFVCLIFAAVVFPLLIACNFIMSLCALDLITTSV